MNICDIWSIMKTSHGNAILFKPRDQEIAVPIFIGTPELQSILIGKEGATLSRPHTHDLFINMLSKVNLFVKKIEVFEIKDDVFYSRLVLTGGEYTKENPLTLDSRPSDALAIAARNKCPIYMSSSVIEQAGVPISYFLNEIEEETDNKYSSLREQLEQAVAEEEYEQAAEIRDLLKMLENDDGYDYD